jgi:MFS family permease
MSLATGFLSFVAIAGVLILMPFYLENIRGYPTIYMGLLLGIVPLMLGISSPFSGALSDRLGTRPITVAGLIVMLFGYLVAGTLTPQTSTLGFIVRMFAIGLGMGIFISPNNSAIMGTASREKLGIVSGFLAITRTLGQTTGVAVMGAVWAARTAFHSAGEGPGATTLAPLSAQAAALQDTMHTAAALMAIALVIGIGSFIHEWRLKRKQAVTFPNGST